VLQICQHQLLVLLLVLDSELDQFHESGRWPPTAQEIHDRFVHVGTIIQDLPHGGTGEVSPLGTTVSLPRLHIIGVEETMIIRVERLVPVAMLEEDEILEEPGGVREVPLEWAYIVHRLDDEILRGQTLGQSHRKVADLPVPDRKNRLAGAGVAFGAEVGGGAGDGHASRGKT
jgi:hypothetical protein